VRKISPNVPKLSPHVRKKELKKTKKNQNGLKNATIEIVAGHSEQNEPVFVCLGREYRLVRKRPKKTSKWIEKRNDSDSCGQFTARMRP